MGKKEKIVVYTLLTIIAASFIWSVINIYYSTTKSVPTFGGTYTEGVLGQPTYINPLLAHTETDLSLTRLIFSGLYKYNSYGELVPDLAESMPEISEDQKSYTVKLKHGVKWHNNIDFDAGDVLFTIQTLKDPAYKSPLRNLWQSTSIEKIDDFTVKFTTKDVSGPFIHNLTLPILPEFVWSLVEPKNFLVSNNNLEAVGTGPYALRKIKKTSGGRITSLSLESFSNYFQGKPNIDTITIKFFETEEGLLKALHSREIDGFGFTTLGSKIQLEENQKDIQIVKLPLPQYQVVFFNLTNQIVSDINVRKALDAITDKQKIINKIFHGNALLPSSPLIYNSDTNTALEAGGSDLKQAEKYLEMAGWDINFETGYRTKNDQEFIITISTNDLPSNSKTAEMLAQQWRKLNIKVNLNILPVKQLREEVIRTRNFDVLLFPQKFGADPDPFLFWHSSQTKDPGLNLTGFENSVADQLITEARTTTDTAIRKQKYRLFNKLVSQEVPVIFLNQTLFIYALGKDIKNITLNTLFEPSYRFFDVTNWYIMEKRVFK